MNGLGLHARRLAHTLGGTARRRCQQDAQPGFLQGCDNSLRRGRLTRTGAARQHHYFGCYGLSDSCDLHFVVFDAGLCGEKPRVERSVEERTACGRCQIPQTPCRAAFGMVERRKVDRLPVENQIVGLNHLRQNLPDRSFAGFEKLSGGLHQLLLFSIDVPFVRELSQCIEDAAPAPPRVFLLIAHFPGDAVGGLEADAPDIVGKAVGILPYLLDALLAVFPVDFGRIGRTHAVALQKEHDVLDVFLFLPALTDLRHALASDVGDFVEPFYVGLDDVDGFRSEPLGRWPGRTAGRCP